MLLELGICTIIPPNICWFPNIGLPPNHPLLDGFSSINYKHYKPSSYWGTPIYGNHNIPHHIPNLSPPSPRLSSPDVARPIPGQPIRLHTLWPGHVARALLIGFQGTFSGKAHIFTGKIDGFRLRFSQLNQSIEYRSWEIPGNIWGSPRDIQKVLVGKHLWMMVLNVRI